MPELPKTLPEFLQKNYVNPSLLEQQEPDYWETILTEFSQLGAAAFRQRKKFILNSWRKKYPLP